MDRMKDYEQLVVDIDQRLRCICAVRSNAKEPGEMMDRDIEEFILTTLREALQDEIDLPTGKEVKLNSMMLEYMSPKVQFSCRCFDPSKRLAMLTSERECEGGVCQLPSGSPFEGERPTSTLSSPDVSSPATRTSEVVVGPIED